MQGNQDDRTSQNDKSTTVSGKAAPQTATASNESLAAAGSALLKIRTFDAKTSQPVDIKEGAFKFQDLETGSAFQATCTSVATGAWEYNVCIGNQPVNVKLSLDESCEYRMFPPTIATSCVPGRACCVMEIVVMPSSDEPQELGTVVVRVDECAGKNGERKSERAIPGAIVTFSKMEEPSVTGSREVAISRLSSQTKPTDKAGAATFHVERNRTYRVDVEVPGPFKISSREMPMYYFVCGEVSPPICVCCEPCSRTLTLIFIDALRCGERIENFRFTINEQPYAAKSGEHVIANILPGRHQIAAIDPSHRLSENWIDVTNASHQVYLLEVTDIRRRLQASEVMSAPQLTPPARVTALAEGQPYHVRVEIDADSEDLERTTLRVTEGDGDSQSVRPDSEGRADVIVKSSAPCQVELLLDDQVTQTHLTSPEQ
jgi:hypothetical protein